MTNILYDALFLPNLRRSGAFLLLPQGEGVSHRTFATMVDRLSTTLIAQGVKRGDRVAAQVEKSPTALALYAAVLRIGAVYLPLNTSYTGPEVAFFLQDSQVALLFCDPSRAAELRPAADQAGAGLVTLDAHGMGDWQDVGGGAPPPTAERNGQDLAAILYTSGTTGRPKGAMLSHDNLLSNARTLTNIWGVTPADVLLHALPVYHSHGLFVACNVMLLKGAKMIYLPRFEAEAVVAALPRATMMMGVPTFYTRLLSCPAFTAEGSRHMRLFISGSAPLLAQTHAAFAARTGHVILERYGLTETSMNTSNPLNGARKPGTVGQPLPEVTLRIGADAKDANVGEIEVKGPNVFQGYWGLQQQTIDAFSKDGFFRTGDLGTQDAEGYVTIVGRSKDLIISGGLNIYPKDVEIVIDALPGVLESAVIGLPDEDFGERVVVVIVPEPGIELDIRSIRAALIGRIAKFKIPKEFVLAESLPRNTMGKVQKIVLRQALARKLGG